MHFLSSRCVSIVVRIVWGVTYRLSHASNPEFDIRTAYRTSKIPVERAYNPYYYYVAVHTRASNTKQLEILVCKRDINAIEYHSIER